MKRFFVLTALWICASGLWYSNALAQLSDNPLQISCSNYYKTPVDSGLKKTEWHVTMTADWNGTRSNPPPTNWAYQWYYDRAHIGTFTLWTTTYGGYSSSTPLDADLGERFSVYVILVPFAAQSDTRGVPCDQ